MKWTFLAGIGLGTAIGMLVAPKSGDKLREDLQAFAQDKVDHARERLQPIVEQVEEKLPPLVSDARESVESIVGELFEGVEKDRDGVAKNSGETTEGVSSGLMAVLNEWPHERLIQIDGIGPVLATRIIQNRPYKSEQELVDSKELPPSAIESLRKAA